LLNHSFVFYLKYTNMQGGIAMAQMKWITSFDEALARARSEAKPVFADFFNPG